MKRSREKMKLFVNVKVNTNSIRESDVIKPKFVNGEATSAKLHEFIRKTVCHVSKHREEIFSREILSCQHVRKIKFSRKLLPRQHIRKQLLRGHRYVSISCKTILSEIKCHVSRICKIRFCDETATSALLSTA